LAGLLSKYGFERTHRERTGIHIDKYTGGTLVGAALKRCKDLPSGRSRLTDKRGRGDKEDTKL